MILQPSGTLPSKDVSTITPSLISISVFTIPPSIMAFPFFISKLFIIYYTPLFQEQVTAKQPLPHKA